LKYVDTDYTMPVKDLGITDADLANQYQYTKDQVVIDYNLAILYPFAGYVVGVYTISIVYGRYHVVTGCFHLLSGCGEGIPIRYRLLNLCRIIGSQNSLSSLTT